MLTIKDQSKWLSTPSEEHNTIQYTKKLKVFSFKIFTIDDTLQKAISVNGPRNMELQRHGTEFRQII